jgi:hypothetical protein
MQINAGGKLRRSGMSPLTIFLAKMLGLYCIIVALADDDAQANRDRIDGFCLQRIDAIWDGEDRRRRVTLGRGQSRCQGAL